MFFVYVLLTAVGFCHSLAVVQYTFTHKQYTERHNETEQNIKVKGKYKVHPRPGHEDPVGE